MADKIKAKEVLFNPLSKNNPVVVQILGICSVLAVTAKLEPSIVMGVSVIAVRHSPTSSSRFFATPFRQTSVSSCSS